MAPREIYLDHAATSAIRPPEVAGAVAAFLRDVGATPGRAGHRRSVEAGRLLLRLRRKLAALLNLPGDPGRIAFQLNATHALNAALLGVLRPGDRLVRTAYDHNAVRRPASYLAARGVDVVVLGGDAAGGVDLGEAREALRGARLLAIPHAANVMGHVLPVRALADLAHEAGALVLLDAAQTVGARPVDAQALGADLLAFPGHKGLLGPQGTGALWARPGVSVEPVLAGGTGADSTLAGMPDEWPDHLEAGTQNAPGLAGLLAGVEHVERTGPAAEHARLAALAARLRAALAAAPGVRLRSPETADGAAIVTVTVDGQDPAETARRLEREHGVLVRAGLHCAPGQHALLGTLATGAVRLSAGWATTEADVDDAARAVAALAREASGGETSSGGAG